MHPDHQNINLALDVTGTSALIMVLILGNFEFYIYRQP